MRIEFPRSRSRTIDLQPCAMNASQCWMQLCGCNWDSRGGEVDRHGGVGAGDRGSRSSMAGRGHGNGRRMTSLGCSCSCATDQDQFRLKPAGGPNAKPTACRPSTPTCTLLLLVWSLCISFRPLPSVVSTFLREVVDSTRHTSARKHHPIVITTQPWSTNASRSAHCC